MKHEEISDITIKGRDCLIRFLDKGKFLYIDRENGSISACLSFPFALKRKDVFEFSRGIENKTELLYIEFQAKDGRAKVPVGRIKDAKGIEDFIKTVNPLYKH